MHNVEHAVTITSNGQSIVVRGTTNEVKAVTYLRKDAAEQLGKITELVHTQPGIRNVVPSLEDLSRNLPTTILSRGDAIGSVTKITYTVEEVKQLRSLLKAGLPDDKRTFYRKLVDIFNSRSIKPPESMLVEMDALGMPLPR